MSSIDSHLKADKQIWLTSTEITVVKRTTISGITHETSQAVKTFEVLGSDTAVCDISAALIKAKNNTG